MNAERAVKIYCPGGYHGTALAATGYFSAPCREKRCTGGDGARSVTHWWDLRTGYMVDEPATTPERPEAGVTPQGAARNG